MKKHLIILYLLFSYHSLTQAQTSTRKYPAVGDILSDHTFTDLVNFPQKTVKISDFRGKWVILDFWGYTCGACIASFPRMDKLSEQFKDRVKLIMVGATKNGFGNTKEIEATTKDLYRRLEKKHNLKFTVAFDSVLYLKHDVGSLPHIILIDPSGVIQAKTQHIDSAEVFAILSGRMPDFTRTRSYSRSEPREGDTYNLRLPFLTTGRQANGGVDTAYLFRSVLASYTDNMPRFNSVDINNELYASGFIKNGRLDAFGFSVDQLYKLAYFGIESWNQWDFWGDYQTKLYPNIFIENKNLTSHSYLDSVNRYAYSLKVPKEKSNREFLMRCLQDDLNKYFGYRAKIEERNLPVWYLEIVNREKLESLVSRGGIKTSTGTYDYSKVTNMPIKEWIRRKIKGLYQGLPIIDNVTFDKNVDILYKANFVDRDDVISNLEKNVGLKLVKGEKKMKVIVLTE